MSLGSAGASSGTPYRPPPPKPTRLNHVAVLAVAVLALVTGFVVVATMPRHPRTDRVASDTVVAVTPQRPSFPAPPPVAPLTPASSAVSESAVPPSGVASLSVARRRARVASQRVVPKALVVRASRDSACCVLPTGTMIPAVLVTAIRSTVPGLVVAQVERDVYDTPSSRVVLVPRGAKLIGRYDSRVARGEDALSVVWTRLAFPDGRSLALPDFESADLAGTAGLRGSVDAHRGRGYRDAALMAVVGAGAQLSQPSAIVPFAPASPGQVVAGSLGQEITQHSLEELRADARLTPVITVRGGTTFMVVATHDLFLPGSNSP
jgi:Bacterial conjugation TrbI-like protein